MVVAEVVLLLAHGLADVDGVHVDRVRGTGTLEEPHLARNEQERDHRGDDDDADPQTADAARAAATGVAPLLLAPLLLAPFAARRDRHLTFKNTHLNWAS